MPNMFGCLNLSRFGLWKLLAFPRALKQSSWVSVEDSGATAGYFSNTRRLCLYSKSLSCRFLHTAALSLSCSRLHALVPSFGSGITFVCALSHWSNTRSRKILSVSLPLYFSDTEPRGPHRGPDAQSLQDISR